MMNINKATMYEDLVKELKADGFYRDDSPTESLITWSDGKHTGSISVYGFSANLYFNDHDEIVHTDAVSDIIDAILGA